MKQYFRMYPPYQERIQSALASKRNCIKFRRYNWPQNRKYFADTPQINENLDSIPSDGMTTCKHNRLIDKYLRKI